MFPTHRFWLFAVFFFLMANTIPALAQDKSLKLYNNHTREKIDVTFMRGGKFDKKALKQLNHFLRDHRRNEAATMDPELFDLLWNVANDLNALDKRIAVVSGYRSKKTNDSLRAKGRKTAKNSQHTRGKAIDFKIPGISSSEVRKVGFKYQVGGVGHYPNFTHLDTGSVRSWPRMSRAQLSKIFPDGKTLHIPSDGKPLKGYAQARKLESAGKLALLGNIAPTYTSSGSLFAKLFGVDGNNQTNKPVSASSNNKQEIVTASAKDSVKKLSPEDIIARAQNRAQALNKRSDAIELAFAEVHENPDEYEQEEALGFELTTRPRHRDFTIGRILHAGVTQNPSPQNDNLASTSPVLALTSTGNDDFLTQELSRIFSSVETQAVTKPTRAKSTAKLAAKPALNKVKARSNEMFFISAPSFVNHEQHVTDLASSFYKKIGQQRYQSNDIKNLRRSHRISM